MCRLSELIHDIGDKYDLRDEVIEDCMKKAINCVFADTQTTVELFLENKSEISIYMYRPRTGFETKMSINKMSVRTVNAIKRKFEKELMIQKTIKEYQGIKHIMGTLLGGYIYDVKDDFISVMIDGIPDTLAFYPLRYQPKHERSRYRRGDYYFFYILSVYTVMTDKKTPKVNIILSRASIKLPALIIQKQLNDEGLNMFKKIKCVKRQAGLYSVIKTNNRIPKQLLEYTSQELGGEKIYVQNEK